jgi:hypothetical protein
MCWKNGEIGSSLAGAKKSVVKVRVVSEMENLSREANQGGANMVRGWGRAAILKLEIVRIR